MYADDGEAFEASIVASGCPGTVVGDVLVAVEPAACARVGDSMHHICAEQMCRPFYACLPPRQRLSCVILVGRTCMSVAGGAHVGPAKRRHAGACISGLEYIPLLNKHTACLDMPLI